MKVLNIKFRGENLEKRLSNLFPYTFIIDGFEMKSYEGFIQSIRVDEQIKQKQFWNLSGFEAWKTGQGIDWWSKQEVYWLGEKINRQSEEYFNLITKSYDCLFENEKFKEALLESLPFKLEHTIGKTNKFETLLTRCEFLFQLNRLRDKLTERKFYSLF